MNTNSAELSKAQSTSSVAVCRVAPLALKAALAACNSPGVGYRLKIDV